MEAQLQDTNSFSIVQQSNSIGLTEDQIVETVNSEEQSEMVSIASAVDSGSVVPTVQSAYGRSELRPSSVTKMKSSGILPLSRATYQDKAKLRANKSLGEKLQLSGMNYEETKGFRVRLAYRLIRFMARIRGEVPGFSRLTSCLHSAWTTPQKFDPFVGYAVGTRGIRSMLYTWSNSENTFTYHNGNRIKTVKGITYLPPQIPDSFYIADGAESIEEIWHMRATQHVPHNYDPNEDEALAYYCYSMEMLADRLSVHEGTTLEPDSGVLGLAGLLSPRTARITWPTVDELTMFEDELILYIYDEIIGSFGTMKIEKEIMERFGVERQEATDLYKMAQEVGSILYREDMEQARSTMIHRLGEIADHAKPFDIRTSLKAMNDQAKLRGLTRTEETSEMEELRSFATKAVEFNERD